MRIVGEISHPRIKISLFQFNGKYSIKFEKQQVEQLIKFNDFPVGKGPDDIKKLVTEDMLVLIERELNFLIERKVQWLREFDQEPDLDFPEII